MSKIQTLVITKDGSDWNSVDDCLDQLSRAISETNIVNDIYSYRPETVGTLSGQTYTEVYAWDTNDDLVQYKATISNYEASIEEALTSAGWTITETVTDG
jgi:hypothetical protein